jgi:hypothetical protein
LIGFLQSTILCDFDFARDDIVDRGLAEFFEFFDLGSFGVEVAIAFLMKRIGMMRSHYCFIFSSCWRLSLLAMRGKQGRV